MKTQIVNSESGRERIRVDDLNRRFRKFEITEISGDIYCIYEEDPNKGRRFTEINRETEEERYGY